MKIIFKWYDLWIGFFIDTKKRLVYFFPIPCIGFVFPYQKAKKLPDGYYFNDSYSLGEYPYVPFNVHGQVGAFKTREEAIDYCITQDKLMRSIR